MLEIPEKEDSFWEDTLKTDESLHFLSHKCGRHLIDYSHTSCQKASRYFTCRQMQVITLKEFSKHIRTKEWKGKTKEKLHSRVNTSIKENEAHHTQNAQNAWKYSGSRQCFDQTKHFLMSTPGNLSVGKEARSPNWKFLSGTCSCLTLFWMATTP